MKLELSDFSYLGIDILKYSDEEREIFKNGIEVDDLIKELFDEKNLLPVSISSADVGDFKYKIYEDISRPLHNNVITLFNIICKLRFIKDEATAINAYKLILEGMIELREKGINVLHKELNPFKDGEFIEVEFIERYYLYPEILEVLKGRNIKRLKQLFEERENLTTKPLKAYMKRETEKRQELQQFLTRFIELIGNAPDEIYEDYSTLTFYNRLNSLAKEYKKYEADNCEKDQNNMQFIIFIVMVISSMVAINFAFRAHLLWGVLCIFFTIISMMIVFDSYNKDNIKSIDTRLKQIEELIYDNNSEETRIEISQLMIEFDCIDDLLRHLNEKGEGEGYETLGDILNFDNHFKPKSKDNNGINFIRFTTVLAHMVLLEAAWECDKYNSKWWKNKRLELETLYKKHTDYVS